MIHPIPPGTRDVLPEEMRELRRLHMAMVEVFEAPAPRAPRDLVLVQGVEPSMRWRSFSANLIDLAEALGVQVVVSLGALLGDVPHTRPVAITGHASDPALGHACVDVIPRLRRTAEILLAGLMYFTKKKVWSDVHHA